MLTTFFWFRSKAAKPKGPKPRSPVALRREMRPQSPPAWNPRVVEGLFSSLQRLSGFEFQEHRVFKCFRRCFAPRGISSQVSGPGAAAAKLWIVGRIRSFRSSSLGFCGLFKFGYEFGRIGGVFGCRQQMRRPPRRLEGFGLKLGIRFALFFEKLRDCKDCDNPSHLSGSCAGDLTYVECSNCQR